MIFIHQAVEYAQAKTLDIPFGKTAGPVNQVDQALDFRILRIGKIGIHLEQDFLNVIPRSP